MVGFQYHVTPAGNARASRTGNVAEAGIRLNRSPGPRAERETAPPGESRSDPPVKSSGDSTRFHEFQWRHQATGKVSERLRSGPRAADVPAGRGGGARRRGSRHHGPAAATHEVVGLGQDMAQVLTRLEGHPPLQPGYG